MTRGARPRSPLVPQVWLERGRVNLTRQWPLDLLRRAAVVPSKAKTRKHWDEGTKGPTPRRGCLRGFVQRVPRAAAPPVSRGDASPTWTITPQPRAPLGMLANTSPRTLRFTSDLAWANDQRTITGGHSRSRRGAPDPCPPGTHAGIVTIPKLTVRVVSRGARSWDRSTISHYGSRTRSASKVPYRGNDLSTRSINSWAFDFLNATTKLTVTCFPGGGHQMGALDEPTWQLILKAAERLDAQPATSAWMRSSKKCNGSIPAEGEPRSNQSCRG
jgi:hypothetical protein